MTETDKRSTVEAVDLWALPTPDRGVAIVAALFVAWCCNAVVVPVVFPVETARDKDAFYYLMSWGPSAALVRTFTVLAIAVAAVACRRALARWWDLRGSDTSRIRSAALHGAWVLLTTLSWPLISDLLYGSLWMETHTFWMAAAAWGGLAGSVALRQGPRTHQTRRLRKVARSLRR